MSMKTLLTLITLLSLSTAAMASEEYFCTREGSTRSFGIDLDAYERDGSQFAAVRVVQYPNEEVIFYKILKNVRTRSGNKIDLNNPQLRFQPDRDLVLREGNNKTTLEVFWTVGCTGFCSGGDSGSIFYDCQATK